MKKENTISALNRHYLQLKDQVKNEIMPNCGTYRYEHFTEVKCLKRLSYLNVKLLQLDEKTQQVLEQWKKIA